MTRWILVVLFLILLLFLWCNFRGTDAPTTAAEAPAAQSAPTLQDAGINQDVLARIRGALRSAGLGWVDVSLVNGEVRVAGEAPDALARERVLGLARRIVGTRGDVVDAMTVKAAAAVAAAEPTSTGAADCSARARGLLGGAEFRFDSGNAVLRSADAQVLRSVAALASSECGNLRLEIEGHADASGDAAANQRLSEQRANSVAGALRRYGFPAAGLRVIGAGESDPSASNDSLRGRAANRRVEVSVTGG